MPRQIWILALGRLFLQTGSGFIVFYVTIFFVNEIGLPAALVGFAVGCQAIASIGGRFLGGICCDSQYWGRRGTLLLSAAISALGDAGLTIADNLPLLILANLFLGLGIGIYWPTIEAIIADLSTENQRYEAHAIATVADTIGLAIGTFFGGQIIGQWGNYRILFVLQGVAFLVFFTIIALAIVEPDREQNEPLDLQQDWLDIWSDRVFLLYILVNTFFIFYINQIYTILSLYFTNFITKLQTGNPFDIKEIGLFMTYYISLNALCQIPIARFLNNSDRFQGLRESMLFWGGGFLSLSAIGIFPQRTIFLIIIAMTLFSLGTATHGPSAFALMADLAPKSLRGIYFAWSNQSWGIGFALGPVIGSEVMGFAMEQNTAIAHFYWLAIAVTTAIGIVILAYIQKLLKMRKC
ncbi:MAG: MFS transporter [Cyanobacteria bacterium SBLK]|nr:MFS transporter [Cyanobacteria bacterium SBLK]